MLNKRAFKMKITKSRLKQIISEELARLDEIDNAQVQIQTAQSMMDDENRSNDPEVKDEICHLLDQVVNSSAKLTDPDIKQAIISHVESLKILVQEVEENLSNNEF
jgi:hypothetical protein